MVTARVHEIFSSLQGEGIRLGERQIFVRFAGCNLDCSYCDTPASRSAEDAREVAVDEVVAEIDWLNSDRQHPTIALTGGEPLLYEEFLSAFLPRVKKRGFLTYLDTNGTHPERLKRLILAMDIVAMDLKLVSDCGQDLWEAHRQFLRAGLGKIFVKIVLTGNTTGEEIAAAVRMIAEIDPQVTLVLQPVTAVAGVEDAPQGNILAWWQMALKILPDTRLIPQKHLEWNLP